MQAALEDAPLRIRDAVKLSHFAVGLISAFVTVMAMLVPLAIWKGTVDEKLSNQHEMLQRLENKMDGLTDAFQRRQP